MGIDGLYRRRCGARLSRDRGYCRAVPVPGHWRCVWHGGKSTGPRTPEGMRNTLAAMAAGRRRWVERMKAAGLRLPGGGRPGVRSRDKRIAQAQLELMKMKSSNIPVPFSAEVLPADRAIAERQGGLAIPAIEALEEILALPLDPDHPAFARIVRAKGDF